MLLIAFRASQFTGVNVQRKNAGLFARGADTADGFFVQAAIRDNSAVGNFFATQFKLRFYQNQKIGAVARAGRSGSQYARHRNKRNVQDDEVREFRNVRARELARVTLDAKDARILL